MNALYEKLYKQLVVDYNKVLKENDYLKTK